MRTGNGGLGAEFDADIWPVRERQALLMVSEGLGFLNSAGAPLPLSEQVVAQSYRLRESLRRLRQPNHG